MPNELTVKLDRTIQSATVIGSQFGNSINAESPQQPQDTVQLQIQQAALNELCSHFKSIVETLAQMQSHLFRQYKDDIINLAVEIARKILAQRVEKADYQIQDVIKQAIGDAPMQNDLVIRLNPKDYAQIEQLTKTSGLEFAKGASFVADAGISPAQCLIETPKGIVESFIDQHLDRISEALKKAG